jgi:hypothetical protein
LASSVRFDDDWALIDDKLTLFGQFPLGLPLGLFLG